MKLVNKIERFVNEPLPPFKMLQVIIASICIFIPAVLWINDSDDFYPSKIDFGALSYIEKCTTTIKLDSVKKYDHGELKKNLLQVKICKPDTSIITVEKIPKDGFGFRLSMSDYVYSSKSYLFGLLYCLAAMLFIFNGVMNITRKEDLSIDKYAPWYNIFIGIFLIGVVFSPQRDHPLLHNIFTGLFFAGNIFTMWLYATPNETRPYKIIRKLMAIAIIIVIAITITPTIQIFTVLQAEWFSLTLIGFHLIMVAYQQKKMIELLK